MLGKLLGKKVKKTCPKCGDKFTCVSGEKCWCDNEMPLSRETIKKIRLSYIDCLCMACLKAYAEEEPKTTGNS